MKSAPEFQQSLPGKGHSLGENFKSLIWWRRAVLVLKTACSSFYCQKHKQNHLRWCSPRGVTTAWRAHYRLTDSLPSYFRDWWFVPRKEHAVRLFSTQTLFARMHRCQRRESRKDVLHPAGGMLSQTPKKLIAAEMHPASTDKRRPACLSLTRVFKSWAVIGRETAVLWFFFLYLSKPNL